MRMRGFFLSTIIGVTMTLICRKVAIKFKFLDRPNKVNKHQEKAVPYMGGVAIFLTLIINIFINDVQIDYQLKMLLIFSLAVMLVGLFDDKYIIGYQLKFGTQFIVAILSIVFGAKVELFNIDILNYIFSFLWIIGLMNAYNIIDGMDGLASGIGIIVSLGFSYFTYKNSMLSMSQIMVLLAGAQAGFLIFNWPPAKIYLGDAGSLFIGYVFAIVSIFCFWKEGFTYNFPIPIYLLYLPIFDTIFVFIKRISDGKSPFKTTEDHYPRRLKKMGYSIEQIDIFSILVSITLTILGVSINYYNRVDIGIVLVFIFTIIFTKYLLLDKEVRYEKNINSLK